LGFWPAIQPMSTGEGHSHCCGRNDEFCVLLLLLLLFSSSSRPLLLRLRRRHRLCRLLRHILHLRLLRLLQQILGKKVEKSLQEAGQMNIANCFNISRHPPSPKYTKKISDINPPLYCNYMYFPPSHLSGSNTDWQIWVEEPFNVPMSWVLTYAAIVYTLHRCLIFFLNQKASINFIVPRGTNGRRLTRRYAALGRFLR